MCLHVESINPDIVNECKFYKVVEVVDGKLCAPFYSNYEYHVGYNKADGDLNKDIIVQGGAIHVKTNECGANVLKEFLLANYLNNKNYAIVEVQCDMKDFIAYGYREAAFRGVTITEEEYDKALNVYN